MEKFKWTLKVGETVLLRGRVIDIAEHGIAMVQTLDGGINEVIDIHSPGADLCPVPLEGEPTVEDVLEAAVDALRWAHDTLGPEEARDMILDRVCQRAKERKDERL